MNCRLTHMASAELEDAVAFYNQQASGLGYEFAAEFMVAIDRIRDFPDAWPVFEATIRRYRLTRFPYGVLYHIEGQTLLILAIMHLAIDPARWRERANPLGTHEDN